MHNEIIDQEIEHLETVNRVVSLIKETQLSVNHLSGITAALCKNMENLIYSCSKGSVWKCKNLNETYETNCKDCIETKCRPLVSFLASFT